MIKDSWNPSRISNPVAPRKNARIVSYWMPQSDIQGKFKSKSKDSGKREGMDMLKLPQQFLHMNGIGDRAEAHNAISFRIIVLILFDITVK